MTCCKENVDAILGNDVSTSLLETSGKRKKKFTGGNASKRHRDRVNIEFSNLAKLLPFSESVIAKLDKSSILRLAVSFIRAKSFFKDAERAFESRLNTVKNGCKKEDISSAGRHIKEGTGVLSEMFSQALDGFLLVLTEDMKVLFVSESVRDYLGYCQAGIIHENFLQFVNPSDHPVIQSCLMYRKNEIETKPYNVHQPGYHERHMFNNEHLSKCFENGHNRNIARRRFICRMKCAFSCSSRFYTAYRTFQFSGHLRRSTIQEGREQKHLNSLVVFAVPIPHTSNTSVEPVTDTIDRSTTSHKSAGPVETNDFTSYYERFGSGFRIEPTLRPHIAPIPVSRTDHTERQSPSSMTRVRSCNLVDVSSLDIRQREYIYISRDSQPCITKTFSAPGSNESRYSDYSDDSKCSPASSPNLLWKNRPTSPYLGQLFNKTELTDQYRVKDALCREHEKYMRRPMSEKEYCSIKLRASPDAYEKEFGLRELQSLKCESQAYITLYNGTNNMLTDHRDNIHPPDIVPYQRMDQIDRKRNIMNKDLEQHNRMPPKRNKTPNGTKRCDFNISSLLGLDQKETKIIRDYQQIGQLNRDEDDVDVCVVEEETEQKSYRNIFESMPNNLTYTRSMPAITPQS